MQYRTINYFYTLSFILVLFFIVVPFHYCFSGTTIVKTIEIAEISATLEEITFTSDHNILKNNTTTWGDEGNEYKQPEWKEGGAVNYPMTHNINKKLTINVKLKVSPYEFNNFELTGKITGSKSELIQQKIENNKYALKEYRNVVMEQDKIIASQEKIGKKSIYIKWFFSYTKRNGVEISKNIGSTGPHNIYLLYSKPKETVSIPLWDEKKNKIIEHQMKNVMTEQRIKHIFSICKTETNNTVITAKELYGYLIKTKIPAFNQDGPLKVKPIWKMFNGKEYGSCIAQCVLLLHMVEIIGITNAKVGRVFASTDRDFKYREDLKIFYEEEEEERTTNSCDAFVGVYKKNKRAMNYFEGVFIYDNEYYLGQVEEEVYAKSPHQVHTLYAKPETNKTWLLYFCKNPNTNDNNRFICFDKDKKKYDHVENVPINKCLLLP